MHSVATLDAIRDWLQLARLAVFASFLLLGIRVVRAGDGPARRRRINQLIAFVIAIHLGLVATGQDAWPFTLYPMMSVDVRDRARVQELVVLRAVDDAGREWAIDPNAFSPLYAQNMTAWIDVVGPKLTRAELDGALRHMLARAEAARARRVAGERYIGNANLLGPIAAPDIDVVFDVVPSPKPFRALRVYRVRWVPAEFARDRRRIAWQLEREVTR